MGELVMANNPSYDTFEAEARREVEQAQAEVQRQQA
jgi:hypothetical protein